MRSSNYVARTSLFLTVVLLIISFSASIYERRSYLTELNNSQLQVLINTNSLGLARGSYRELLENAKATGFDFVNIVDGANKIALGERSSLSVCSTRSVSINTSVLITVCRDFGSLIKIIAILIIVSIIVILITALFKNAATSEYRSLLKVVFNDNIPSYIKARNLNELISEIIDKQDQITAYKSQIDQLERTKLYNDIVSQVAHDIRSPISALKFAEPGSDLAKRALQQIEMIANDLLKQRKELAIHNLADTEITDLLNRILQLKQLEYPNVRFSLNAPKPAKVSLDESILMRILSNLLNNSATYGSGHTEITVTDDPNNIFIKIFNYGDRFNDSVINELANKGHVSYPSGNGMGLKFVIDSMKAINGNAAFENISAGSLITLTIPKSLTRN